MKADFPPERWFNFDPSYHRGQSTLLHRQSDNVWRLDFQLGGHGEEITEGRLVEGGHAPGHVVEVGDRLVERRPRKPGDLAEEILGQNALPETVAAFRKELKLDLPPHERYIAWLGDLVQGNLGNSLSNQRPVADLVGWRFANTIFLASTAAVISVPLAILLGLLAALYRDSLFDKAISTSTLSAISFPEFFIAYILIALLSVKLVVFPSISNIKFEVVQLPQLGYTVHD